MSPVRRSLSLAVLFATGLLTGVASPKPKKGEGQALAAIEARASKLAKSKDLRADFDAFAGWLGLPSGCSNACESVASVKWVSGNLDSDAEDEKVLAITTRGAGACGPATVELIAFDPAGGGEYAVIGSEQIEVAGARSAEISFAAVHSSSMKDLVVSAEGQCAEGGAERVLRVYTLEHGHLEELAASDSAVGRSFVSHAFVGGVPAAIELTTSKGVTKLEYDPLHGYDHLPSYEQIKKEVVSASDDKALDKNECAAPLGPQLALDCQLAGSARLEVMVQNGKAVGVTVSSTPVNRFFGHCARKKLAAASWKSIAAASGCTRTFAVK